MKYLIFVLPLLILATFIGCQKDTIDYTVEVELSEWVSPRHDYAVSFDPDSDVVTIYDLDQSTSVSEEYTKTLDGDDVFFHAGNREYKATSQDGFTSSMLFDGNYVVSNPHLAILGQWASDSTTTYTFDGSSWQSETVAESVAWNVNNNFVDGTYNGGSLFFSLENVQLSGDISNEDFESQIRFYADHATLESITFGFWYDDLGTPNAADNLLIVVEGSTSDWFKVRTFSPE